MENKKLDEQLKTLSNDEIEKIKTIIDVLEIFLIPTKEYRDDYVEVKYFKNIDFMELVKLLTKLDKDFGIINFQRRRINGAVDLMLKDQNPKKLSVFKNLIYSIDTSKVKIKKITFVDAELGLPCDVVFNDDYINYKEANRKPLYWGLLRKIALNEPVLRKEVENQYTHLTNVEKFPFKEEYAYTKILRVYDGQIISNIEFERSISSSEFRKRRKKQLKK